MKSSTSISISTEETMDAAASASPASACSAAAPALPILKSTETRTLLPGLKKRQSIRRSPSHPPSHSRVPNFLECAVFLAAVCLFMGLNMYLLDGRDSHHPSDKDKPYYSLMQRGLLRATTTTTSTTTGQHQEEDYLTGSMDAQWMQQTLHGDNHGRLRQLYEHDESNTMPEEEKPNGRIRVPTTTAHMDLP